MLFRFRRYRVFLIFAFFVTFILVRLSRNRDWNAVSEDVFDVKPKTPENGNKNQDAAPVAQKQDQYIPPSSDKGRPIADTEEAAFPKILPSSSAIAEQPFPSSKLQLQSSVVQDIPSTKITSTPTIPDTALPDRRPPNLPKPVDDDEIEQLHAESPGKVEPYTFSPKPSPIHWEKQKEHFAVPPGSLIKLPTGAPKPIPKIQYQFSDESTDTKLNRESRQSKVKDVFKHAWNGYKTKGWLHDEVKPVSGKYRDPFAGWAATLVDSLDTLWIMDLKEEFEEAVKAVETIDFTTSKRNDIQMFEVTIRYLGGMIAAYDVSGGKYKILLSKAVELADIMMGAFDTPNRMPVLYYNWKPAFASQPHRASVRSNLAEIGSLSMEFTRLAQLTKQDKYYDAVARITNALEEYQNRGTDVDGVFPDNVDASGCNRTATAARKIELEGVQELHTATESLTAQGYTVPMPETVREPSPNKMAGVDTLELEIIPGQPSKGQVNKVDDPAANPGQNGQKFTKRQTINPAASNSSTTHQSSNNTSTPAASAGELSPRLPFGTSKDQDWDCVTQGIDASAGSQGYSMGGGQDSTYEYFPKQYLLLGGLEDKYRTMYLKTMNSVRQHMLYRPMVPENRDILFSGKVTKRRGVAKLHLDTEITHLTCFIGGMVGMGAKIFELPTDVDIAERLTDGCVWAYESMPSGIMPEYAHVFPCESIKNCVWNETLWWAALDPLSAAQRERQIKTYEENKSMLAAQREEERKAEEAKVAAEDAHSIAGTAADSEIKKQPSGDSDLAERITPEMATDVDSKAPSSTRYEDSLAGNALPDDSAKSHTKRQIAKEGDTELTTPNAAKAPVDVDPAAKELQEKLAAVEDELKELKKLQSKELDTALPQKPLETNKPLNPTPTKQNSMPKLGNHGVGEASRPETHEEYVKKIIKNQRLPAGYTQVNTDQYILRPEAIESVWYMYRITGDPIWQEKGWKMFESIIEATTTKYGHSAVRQITLAKPTLVDEMESFWLAETLKYFYLLYSTPETISLDDWVLNTEAHPFKRPV